jgi:hypothetical protein
MLSTVNASGLDHPMLWLFIGLLVTFAGTRFVTRRIRAGSTSLSNWSIAGIHVHHQVFGVLLVLVIGCLEFAYRPTAPWSDVLGLLFGAGVALTLDEFALWLYMDDVYWRAEGRVSLDAMFVAAAVSGCLLLGMGPSDLATDGLDAPAVLLVAAKVLYVAAALIPSVIAMLKGKPIVAVIGLFVWVVAIVAAIRLAKPTSPWARRRYPPGSRRRLRADRRFGPAYAARWNRVRDLIGGRPDPKP